MGILQLIEGYLAGLRKFSKESRLNKLQRKRLEVIDKIKLAEKKLLKHEIDESAFKELNDKFTKELITLEASIEIEKIEERLKKFTMREAEKLSEKRKHALSKLLEEKEKIKKELERAKQLYLKRRLSEQSYKEIIKEKQEQLIRVEAGINCLCRAEAREVMQRTEQKLAMSEEEAIKAEAEEIASDITQQIEDENIYFTRESEHGEITKIRRRERSRARRERTAPE